MIRVNVMHHVRQVTATRTKAGGLKFMQKVHPRGV
jgi:hypothetical protein